MYDMQACNNYGRNENNDLLSDVILYLQTVLVAESLSEKAEMQRQLLLEKLTNKNMTSSRSSYMDMNGRSKGLLVITKSNSFACLHQQAAYEELCGSDQPIYNNVPYEDDPGDDFDDVLCNGYEPFAARNGRGPPKTDPSTNLQKRHSAPNSGDCGGSSASTGSLHKSALNGSSASSRSNSDSSESGSCTKSGDAQAVYVLSANAVRYSASKYGALTKREKILFVDHARKYWAAVLSSTMYVYNGEKDPKPCLVVHLDGYTARDANGGGNRNRDWTFEVVCPGKKTYQFIAQNQKDMHSWIEAINNSNSKPSTPEIMHSASPILCFKQELLPNRQLPVPPTADVPTQDYFYDRPNPIIRPVNLYENPTDEVDADESIYHFIDESKREKDTPKNDDKQFLNGDTSYYNIPSSIPVPVIVAPTPEDRNNNDYEGYFTTEKETCYDIITNDGREMTEDPVALGVQQIIQKIEGINSKKSSPFLRRKSQPKVNNCGPTRNSTPPVVYEFYEPMKLPTKTGTSNNVCSSQSFRQSR